MSEIRQDPITRECVIINPERARRPRDNDGTAAVACPFCPGNERLTPAPVEVVEGAGRWRLRVVPNLYPVVRTDAPALRDPEPAAGWTSLPGYGRHEVIVECPEHRATLGSMAAGQLELVINMYARRFAVIARDPRIRQIVVFRNYGSRAGTSLTHPHSQIIGTAAVSHTARQLAAAEAGFYDANGGCGLCTVLARELEQAERVVHRCAGFVTLAPFASTAPYQLQIVPRVHCPTFGDAGPGLPGALATHLGQVMRALERCLPDLHFNLVVRTPPLDQIRREASHWSIEIIPRLTTPAGFELGSRISVNSLPPEQAAGRLRACFDPR